MKIPRILFDKDLIYKYCKKIGKIKSGPYYFINEISMEISSILDIQNLADKPKELGVLCKKLFARGKSVRSRLIRLICQHLRLKESETTVLCRIVEYVHNSSLLHDDLIDHSSVRRRQKAAWVEFSPAQAVLAGDYLLAQVNIYLAEKGNLHLLRLTAGSIVSLVKGEFLQREVIRKQAENVKNTNDINNLKTSSLFKWSFKAPFLWKNKKDPQLFTLLNQIGYKCGILFQRSDDLLDFSVRNREKKPVLLDLKQNYLNSFSCFLVSGKSKNFKSRFRKAKTLTDIDRLVPDFKNQLDKFDKLNKKLIKETERDMEKLAPFLKKSEQPLIKDLKSVPSLLYWRKS